MRRRRHRPGADGDVGVDAGKVLLMTRQNDGGVLSPLESSWAIEAGHSGRSIATYFAAASGNAVAFVAAASAPDSPVEERGGTVEVFEASPPSDALFSDDFEGDPPPTLRH